MKKLLIFLLILGCGYEDVETGYKKSTPSYPKDTINLSNLDFLNCQNNLCKVIGEPLVLQNDPNLPTSDPELIQYSGVGCYEAAVVMTNTSALLNRTVGVIDHDTRSYDFDNLVSGYPYIYNNADLLVWQYNNLLHTIPKWNGFYYPELLNSFGDLSFRYPDGCNPLAVGSCLNGENSNGSFFTTWGYDGQTLNNAIFISRLQQKYMQTIAFQWTPNSLNNEVLTIEWEPHGHKVVVSGFLNDGSDYPLLINDPGSGKQTYGKVGTLNTSSKIKMLAITNRGRWAPNTSYNVGDSVSYVGSTYRTMFIHTSNDMFNYSLWQVFDAPLNTWSYFEYKDDANHAKYLLSVVLGIRLY